MQRRMAAVILAAMAAWSGLGCGRGGDRGVKFMYWGDLKEIAIVDSILGKFKKENPDIRVENQRMAAGGPPYDEKLTTLFSGGQEPDVFLVSSYYADKYARFGGLADLTALARSSPALGIRDFYPEILSEFTFEGRLYVVARDVAPVACLYYNKDHFKGMGQKFPDESLSWPGAFAALARKLVKKGPDGKVEVWGYVDDWDELADTFIYSAGGSHYDDPWKPTRMTLDSPAALSGVQFRIDLMYKHGAMPSVASMTQSGQMGTSDMFKLGKVAMLYSGSWKIPDFRDIRDFDWDMALPPKHAGTGRRAWQGGGSGYGMSARIKDPQRRAQAWKLLEFLTKPESQAAFAASGLLQPSNMKVARGPSFLDGRKPANKKILLGAVKSVYSRPRIENWREIMASGISQAMQESYLTGKPASETLAPAVRKVNEKYFSRKP